MKLPLKYISRMKLFMLNNVTTTSANSTLPDIFEDYVSPGNGGSQSLGGSGHEAEEHAKSSTNLGSSNPRYSYFGSQSLYFMSD